MRHLLMASSLVLLTALAAVPAYAGDKDKEGDKKEADKAKHNTFSPVSGQKIDKEKAVSVAIVLGDKTETILVATKEEAETVTKSNDDLKKLYIEAAHHHKMVKDGKLVQIKGAEGKEDGDKKSEKGEKGEHKHDEKKAEK